MARSIEAWWPARWQPSPWLIPLRLKLGILLGTVAALAVAVPTIVHSLLLVGIVERSVNADNLEMARVVGALVEHRVDQTILALELTAASPGFLDQVEVRDAARMKERLFHVVRLDRDLSSVLVVDRHGVVWAHTLDDDRILERNLATAGGLREALQTGTPTMGRAFRSAVTGRPVARLVVPFRDQSEQIIGAFEAQISLDALTSQVESARTGERGAVTLYDRSGMLLSSPNRSAILTRVDASNAPVQAALGGTLTTGTSIDAAGQSAYAVALPVAHGWVVEVTFPAQEAQAPLYTQIARNGLLALVAFVAATLLGIILSRRVTEPLMVLLRTLRSIRHGQPAPPRPRALTMTAEVAWLADEIDTLRSALDARDVEVHQALDTLARYRLLAERMTDIVLFMQHDTTIVDMNRAAEVAYGYHRDELIGQPAYHLMDRPEHRLSAEALAEADRAGLRFETVHRRRDGTLFPAEVTIVGAVSAGPSATPIRMSIVRDITDRQAVEAALRASEAQYRGVVDNIDEVVFQLDTEGRLTFLNRAWTELSGYTIEESLGQSSLRFVHPNDHERTEAQFRALLAREIPSFRLEEQIVTKSGVVRLVDVYHSPTFGPDGSVTGVSGTLTDVTERRKSEKAHAQMLLREQAARAREERAAEVTGIVQHMPCGVLVFDNDSCLILANERAMEMLSPVGANDGILDSDSGVPHPSALLEERLLNPCRSLVARALGGSVVSNKELEVTAPGAQGRTVVGSAVPLLSPEGKIQGAVAILVDVTRERRLVHDLTISEATLRHSLESLLVLNEAGRALSSTLVEEEIGRRLVQSCVRIARLDAALVFLDDGLGGMRLLGADGDPLLVDHVVSCDTMQLARQQVLRSPAPTGWSTVPACLGASIAAGQYVALVARGRTVGVLEIYGTEHQTPVTEDALTSLAAHAVTALENARLYREVGDREQRLQDALRQLLIAQEEERRRVAYDLHDGLAQVAAATHLSLQTFASQYRPRSPETRRQLDRSLDLARRVVREARQAIAGLRPTTLDDFGLERALRLLIQELVNEGWTIEYQADLGPDRLPGPIETVLYRIAQEALTNVGKHAQTQTATVTLRRESGHVALEIVDHGAGFEQAAPPTEHSAGSGPGQHLGLVGMRERAALVGGRCTVSSRNGQGTHVEVRIPLRPDPSSKPVPITIVPSGANDHVA